MAMTEIEMFSDRRRSDWVPLRTLVILRWFAIVGQVAAVVAASVVLDLRFAVGLVSVTIGASVVANLVSTFVYPENRRLSEREATLILVFDVLQLGLLLFLTGGLNNPFALLMLAPVTIAAAVLHLRSTVLLGLLAIVVVSAIALWHLPVLNAAGRSMLLPDLFMFGFWLALVIGIAFLSFYARQVTTEINAMSDALAATQMALSREQKLTDLGGVVAAAAHELGTPLATIKLVSTELIEELEDRPELRDDAALIGSQADRCRDILRSMGQAGKDDLHLRRAPFEAVIREAAEPHLDRGKTLVFAVAPGDTADPAQPVIMRRPEIIHGVRNLVQNAVDFAASRVEIEMSWTAGTLSMRIRDDGPGFPQSVIGRLGDPFVRRRRPAEDRDRRPGYDGMGLGLFIAKTLLERSGARLVFANGGPHGGAIVVVEWPRAAVEAPHGRAGEGLGANRQIPT